MEESVYEIAHEWIEGNVESLKSESINTIIMHSNKIHLNQNLGDYWKPFEDQIVKVPQNYDDSNVINMMWAMSRMGYKASRLIERINAIDKMTLFSSSVSIRFLQALINCEYTDSFEPYTKVLDQLRQASLSIDANGLTGINLMIGKLQDLGFNKEVEEVF